MEIILRQPLKDIYINQPFGANYVDFYQKLGLVGHNGVDFKASHGTPLYAAHDGVIRYCGTDSGGGVQIDIWNKELKYKTIYYHLQKYIVTQDQYVKAGDLIGYCDNTGQMTTGPHLHFGFKYTDENGYTINWDNGYKGASDPMLFIKLDYLGNKLKEEDMIFQKEKNNSDVYLINKEFGTKIMIVDMPTLDAFHGKIEEVDSLAEFIPYGTFIWSERVIR